MKLTKLLLCKSPFTPAYEHLVSGCSAQQLYNCIRDTSEGVKEITMATDAPNNLYIRTANETESSVNITLVCDSFTPQDYNYICTVEHKFNAVVDTQKFRFWFITGYTVENALDYETVTFNCSIDWWHSYGTALTGDDTIDCTIQRMTQNTNSTIFYGGDSFYSGHRQVSRYADRVLWARCRLNTVQYTNATDAINGFMNSGSLLYVYFPISKYPTTEETNLQINGDWTIFEVDGNTLSVNRTDNVDLRPVIYSLSLNTIGSLFNIIDLSLTFIPPFNYNVNGNNIIVNDVNTAFFSVLGVYGIVQSSVGAINFVRDVEFITTNNDSAITPIYDSYPFHYYSMVVGGNSLIVNYKVNRVLYKIRCRGSGDSNLCDLYINNVLVKENIEINSIVKIPINVESAGLVDATYGASYRLIDVITSTSSNVLSGAFNIGTEIGSMLATGAKTPKNSAQEISQTTSQVSGIGAIVSTALNTVNSVNKITGNYRAQENISTVISTDTTSASAFFIGDLPYIIEHFPLTQYNEIIYNRIKIFGTDVMVINKPLIRNHLNFDFISTTGMTVLSNKLPSLSNSILSEAFNRGCYLWHYSPTFSIQSIGNFDITNPNYTGG